MRDDGSRKYDTGDLLVVKAPASANSFRFINMIHNNRAPSTFPILMIYLLCSYTLAAQIVRCDVSTYGKPEKSDCMNLFKQFTSSPDTQARFFDEEQLRADAKDTWPGVANVFKQPIVQLPKFYSLSMSLHAWVT